MSHKVFKLLIIGTLTSFVLAALLQGGGTLIGLDNDNNLNTFIQPIGETDKQHMEDADLLFGDDSANLLIGMLGADTIMGGDNADILVGGAENFRTGEDANTGEQRGSNSDVLLGENGDDINIWSPGDGSDAFLGGEGYDSMIFAPLIHPNGDKNQVPSIFNFDGREIVKVKIDELPQFSCTIEVVPALANLLHYEFIVRFAVNGDVKVTVRLADVEQVLCPSPNASKVQVANLTSLTPTAFVENDLSNFSSSLLGAIIQAP